MPALDLILERLPATLYLSVVALAFSMVIAVPFGVLSAVYRGSWFDRFAKGFAMLGQGCQVWRPPSQHLLRATSSPKRSAESS